MTGEQESQLAEQRLPLGTTAGMSARTGKAGLWSNKSLESRCGQAQGLKTAVIAGPHNIVRFTSSSSVRFPQQIEKNPLMLPAWGGEKELF